jgi:lathosterol oxidase
MCDLLDKEKSQAKKQMVHSEDSRTKMNKDLDKDWSAIPDYIPSGVLSCLVFIMGITMRGDWLMFFAHYKRSQQNQELELMDRNTTDPTELGLWLQERFTGLWPDYMFGATIVSYLFFFGIGGFLHFRYYVMQRDKPEEWKCQPNKWLSGKDEIHEILVGLFSLTLGSVLSACLATWVINGGYTTIYYEFGKYGYLWAILETPVVFIVTDYITYWCHRIYHLPFLYKHFHKLHHTYKQPTAFSVTAIHPIEFLNIQSIYIMPMFLIPIHAASYCAMLCYIYYHGIIDHSGITFKHLWFQPWQPDCIFHDNHHQYFHVNFGFNVQLWDMLHGTLRQKDKIYREDIFYGAGKDISQATKEELQADERERFDENPLAYQQNKNKYL